MLISLIIGIVALSVIILAHEVGHFVTAKASRVNVEEFGIGFPPRLFGVRQGETIYSVNAIPFGGFTKLAGQEDPQVPRSLAGKGIGTRILVLSAGSLMNLLLPFLLFSIAFMVPQSLVVGEVMIEEVAPNSPAAMAGIEPGDTIVSLNEQPVRNFADLQRYTYLNLGEEVDLLIQRHDAVTEEIQIIPRWQPPEGEGAMGILVDMANPTTITKQEPLWRAIPMGIAECIETLALYKNGIISMIIGAAPATIAGPIGIVQLTTEAAKAGIAPLLEFAALISIILGLCNLFPLPALDGGRIIFVLLEWARRGKRVSPRVEGLIHSIGFIMLIGLLLVITYQDIIRVISGESLIP